MQKSIRKDISAVTLKNYCNACQIFSKYYIFLFPLYVIITVVVILLVYSTVCSDIIIVLHQARGL